MIASVATFSLAQATAHVFRGMPGTHLFARAQRAWIGFETGANDRSPLSSISDGPGLVIRCADWDADGRHSPEHVGAAICADAPTLDHARRIVEFVLRVHDAPETRVLCVHCHAGLWRSGAVAEWVRVDLGAEEHACSNRLVNVLIGGRWEGERTFNAALLRLLREAHKERVR